VIRTTITMMRMVRVVRMARVARVTRMVRMARMARMKVTMTWEGTQGAQMQTITETYSMNI
jgi:hypothetical protein